jgi:hypothetical protein
MGRCCCLMVPSTTAVRISNPLRTFCLLRVAVGYGVGAADDLQVASTGPGRRIMTRAE